MRSMTSPVSRSCGTFKASIIAASAGECPLVAGRLRLLFISPRFLFPLDEGGKIRTVGMLRAMKKDGPFEITLVSPAPPDAGRHMTDIASACDRFFSWPPRRTGVLTRATGV